MVVEIRDVLESDLPILFEHQCDPAANAMAAFPARDREAFRAHWKKVLNDPSIMTATITADGRVAGHIGAFERAGRRLVGYWIGREYWGRGIATQALTALLSQFRPRPVYAYVAKHNVASIRVLEKCGFTVAETPPPGEDGVVELLMVLVR